jgi:hypothetical protein
MHKNVGSKVFEYIDKFNAYLSAKVRKDDVYIRKNLVENGKNTITLIIHEEIVNEITKKFLNQ